MSDSPKGLKDAGLQRYYDRLFEMHGSEGWTELLSDVKDMVVEYNRADTIKDERELAFRHGQLDILRWLVGHAEMVERAFLHMVENQDGEEQEAPTGGVAKFVSTNGANQESE